MKKAMYATTAVQSTTEIGRVEHAREQRAQDAAQAVHAEHVERVVGADQLLESGATP